MVVTGFTACNPSFWQDRKTCLEAFQAFQSFGVVRTRYPSPQSLTYVYNGSPAAPQKNQQPNANKPAVFLEASEASTKSITIPDFLEQRQRYYKKKPLLHHSLCYRQLGANSARTQIEILQLPKKLLDRMPSQAKNRVHKVLQHN